MLLVEATVIIAGGYNNINDETGLNTLLLNVLMSTLLLTFIFNVIITVFLGIILCASSALQRRLKAKHHKINYTRVFICLLTLLGLPWFLAYVFAVNLSFDVLLIVISVPQPICMCIALLCNRKVGRMYWSLFLWCYNKFITSDLLGLGNVSSMSSIFSFSSS